MTETLEQTLITYDTLLDRQTLAAKTRVAYRLQIHQYGAYLAQHPATTDDPLHMNAEVREALKVWLKEWTKRFSQTSDPAFFLNPKRSPSHARNTTIGPH